MYHWEFPASLVVRIQHFHCHGLGSIPVGELTCHKPHDASKKRKKSFTINWCFLLEYEVFIISSTLGSYIISFTNRPFIILIQEF